MYSYGNDVSTKDTTALSDAELAEMADLCLIASQIRHWLPLQQREDWVLVTQVREGNKLRGYSFCTLERIGGTPSLLVGLLLVDRNAKSDQTLKTDPARPVPPRVIGVPGRGRALGLSPHVDPTGFAPSPASRTCTAPRLQADGRGPRVGPTPGQALRF